MGHFSLGSYSSKHLSRWQGRGGLVLLKPTTHQLTEPSPQLTHWFPLLPRSAQGSTLGLWFVVVSYYIIIIIS